MSIDTNDDAQLLAFFAGQALNGILANVGPAQSDGVAISAIALAKALRTEFRKEHPRVNR